MIGSEIFKSLFDSLDVETQKSILERLFSVHDISVYYVSLRDNSIVFRLYSHSIFYQYIFDFGQNDSHSFMSVHEGLRLYSYIIYPYYYQFHHEYPYYDLVQLLLCDDTKAAYLLFQSLFL